MSCQCDNCECNKEQPESLSVKVATDALRLVCTNGTYEQQIEAAKTLLNYERGY